MNKDEIRDTFTNQRYIYAKGLFSLPLKHSSLATFTITRRYRLQATNMRLKIEDNNKE